MDVVKSKNHVPYQSIQPVIVKGPWERMVEMKGKGHKITLTSHSLKSLTPHICEDGDEAFLDGVGVKPQLLQGQ